MNNPMPDAVYEGVRLALNELHRDAITIKRFSFIGGGCINHGGRLETDKGVYFLKWNDAKKFPAMFEAEARGLRLLKKAEVVHIPAVVNAGEQKGYQFLLLEYIDQGQRAKQYWTRFGEQLAALHKISSENFGLDHSNYIGSLPQYNGYHKNWIAFFIHERLEIQLQLAESSGRVSASVRKQFDALYKELPNLLVEEKPSLLHGDLWNGNLMTSANGQPCLIDPAVYFGNREADLAMTKLFGGFDQDFYRRYQEVFPLEPGYHQRFEIYNLYPLLVHVNLFGGSYLSQVNSVLANYIQ